MAADSLELARRIVAGWAEGDFREFVSAFAEDTEMSAYMPGGSELHRGRDDVLAYLADFTSQWRNYHVDVEELSELPGGDVILSGRQTGIGGTSGVEIDETVHIVLRFRGEEVAGSYWHVRREGALQAAGLGG